MRRPVRDNWLSTVELLRKTARSASGANVTMMAAGISYYLLVTIVPLLAVVVRVAGVGSATFSLDSDALVDNLSRAASSTAMAAPATGGSTWTWVITTLVVLYGASSVFSQFTLAVSRIWHEPSPRGPVYMFARRHALGFVLLGTLALALVGSMIVGSVVASLVRQFYEAAVEMGFFLPSPDALLLGRFVVDLLTALVLFTVAFSMIPARKLKARQVFAGSLATALAYALGQVALSIYLAHTSRVTMAGTLGSAVALLIWVYYSSLIALYGATLTRELVIRREGRISQS